MRFLLDTHVLLWALADPMKLSKSARDLVSSRENEVLFSAASIWEIAIRSQLPRFHFSMKPAEIAESAVQTGFIELPVRSATAARVAELPPHHRDPFDRLLVAQAMEEPARLLTVDGVLKQYSELVTLI